MVHIKINYNDELVLPLCVYTANGCDVTDMKINDDGALIVVLSDESEHNLGQLIGEYGFICRPPIEKDKHNVFTFTVCSNSEDTMNA